MNFYRIKYFLKDTKYNIRNFISPNHKRFRKCYPRTAYKDLDTLIPDALFALFLDFWHEEVYPDSIVDWGIGWEDREYSDDEVGKFEKIHAEENYQTYCWMKQTAEDIEINLPNLKKEIDKELGIASKERLSDKSYDEVYGKYDELEKLYDDEETRILKEIIENRHKLWT